LQQLAIDGMLINSAGANGLNEQAKRVAMSGEHLRAA
jgi:hypothetical protein